MLDYRRVVPFSSIASPKPNPILLPNQGDFSAFSQADPMGKKTVNPRMAIPQTSQWGE